MKNLLDRRNVWRASVGLSLAVAAGLIANRAAAGEAERQAARGLVRFVLPPEAYRAMVQQSSDAMIQSMRQHGTAVSADDGQKVARAVAEALPYDEVLEWSAEVYAARFTVAELRDIAAFYRTPTGQKTLRLMPDLMAAVGTKIGEILPRRLPAALAKQGLH